MKRRRHAARSFQGASTGHCGLSGCTIPPSTGQIDPDAAYQRYVNATQYRSPQRRGFGQGTLDALYQQYVQASQRAGVPARGPTGPSGQARRQGGTPFGVKSRPVLSATPTPSGLHSVQAKTLVTAPDPVSAEPNAAPAPTSELRSVRAKTFVGAPAPSTGRTPSWWPKVLVSAPAASPTPPAKLRGRCRSRSCLVLSPDLQRYVFIDPTFVFTVESASPEGRTVPVDPNDLKKGNLAWVTFDNGATGWIFPNMIAFENVFFNT